MRKFFESMGSVSRSPSRAKPSGAKLVLPGPRLDGRGFSQIVGFPDVPAGTV